MSACALLAVSTAGTHCNVSSHEEVEGLSLATYAEGSGVDSQYSGVAG